MSCPREDELAEGRAEALDHARGCARCQSILDAATTLDATLDSRKTLVRDRPADDVLADGALVGAYVVSGRLGVGAMGAVYSAWDPRLEREVALKVLHGGGDLLSEARVLAQLSHPNVVTVHEVLSWRDRVVLVMELARGHTLRRWLRATPRTPAEVRDVFTQCAQGLGAAHARGIVHRDFKPDNVLVDTSGRARLLDFGLATPSTSSATGLAGSPAYLALDQLEHAMADATSDQFAWWVSLYEAFAGRVPHDGPTLEALTEARREGALDLSSVPRAWRKAMARGLSNDPTRRFPSMEAAALALAPARRTRWYALAATLAVVLAVAAPALLAASPCDLAAVPNDQWDARATDPALNAAVASFRQAQLACRAVTSEETQATVACLTQAGLELGLALEALDTSPPFDATLAPRILRRVMPAERCLRRPLPPPVHLESDRAALVASLRDHLSFEARRLADDPQGALAVARQHRERAEQGQSVTAKVWASFDEASAMSAVGDAPGALALLRKLQAQPGVGPREQAWVALGRWLFECYSSGTEHCEVAQRQAQRLVSEVDEPWLRAFEAEIATQMDASAPRAAVVSRWRAIPGADWEAQRALGAMLIEAIKGDNLLLARQLTSVLEKSEQPTARLRLLALQFELQNAARDGDLELAQERASAIEAFEGPEREVGRARIFARVLLLNSFGKHAETLAFIDGLETSPTSPMLRNQKLVMQLESAEYAESPRYTELLKQIELVEPQLAASEVASVAGVRLHRALRLRDATALEVLPANEEEGLWRDWQLAVTRGDDAAERDAYRRARAAPEDPTARALVVYEAFVEGAYERALGLARAERAIVASSELSANLRFLEAASLWHLRDRDGACTVLSRHLLMSPFTWRERKWLSTMINDCPRVGRSTPATLP